MEFNQILELIDHVSASELTAFTYETADLTLSMEHGKPQIIQGVIGETVENIPAVGMTGGKVRRAVNTAPVAGKDPVVPASTDEMAVTVKGKTVAKAQGVTEKLKQTNMMTWVGMMNNIKNSARETVLNELIYTM
mgnify:CR=1 FL=1